MSQVIESTGATPAVAGLAKSQYKPWLPLLPAPSEKAVRVSEWFVFVTTAIALTAILCVVTPTLFESMDWVRMHGFYKEYIRTAVADGRLPLWNPHQWLGRPFLADIESAFFYPPEWLYLFLPARAACAVTIAVHLLLCQYGTLKLARALGTDDTVSQFVSIAMAASAPIIANLAGGLVHYGQALCYIPLSLYLGTRIQASRGLRVVGLLALVLGLQVLCGHPQAAWLCLAGLAVFLCGRRLRRPWLPSLAGLGWDIGRAGLSLAFGLAVAAVAVLPLAELAGQGNRSPASLAFAAAFAESSDGWATLMVPANAPLFVVPANGQMYAGMGIFLAGVLGLTRLRNPDARALLLAGLSAALLAGGQSTPIFEFIFRLLPGLCWFRFPSRATVLVTMAFVLSAGVFLSRPSSRRDVVSLIALAVVVTVGGVGFYLGRPRCGREVLFAASFQGALVAVTGTLLVFWKTVSQQRHPHWLRIIGVALVVVSIVDLGTAAYAQKHTNREGAPELDELALQRALEREGLIASDQPPPRVYVPRVRENAGMEKGWSTPHGYSALALARVWTHLHGVLGVRAPVSANTSPSLALAEYGPFPFNSMGLVAGQTKGAGALVFKSRPDPRAYMVPAARLVRDFEEATALMRSGHDFHRVALVESPVALPDHVALSHAEQDKAAAAIVDFTPERVVLSTTSAMPALLVLAEPWFPGWTARVNGAPTPCLPANAWMRAIQVPAGRNEVVLTFRSTYLRSGAAISLTALAAILVLLILSRQPRSVRKGIDRAPTNS